MGRTILSADKNSTVGPCSIEVSQEEIPQRLQSNPNQTTAPNDAPVRAHRSSQSLPVNLATAP